ncbi:hypothetical protein CCACVL1_15118, partial [Corchorus capsularis]
RDQYRNLGPLHYSPLIDVRGTFCVAPALVFDPTKIRKPAKN